MISLQILDTKSFMSKLFKDETFDNLTLANLEIINFANFEIKQKQESIMWKDIRPFAFSIIKSGTTPKSIKIVFSLTKEESENIKPDTNFFLNIYYTNNEESQLIATTGTSMKTFSLDRSGDHMWEDYITKFFAENDIKYEEM